MKCTNCNKLIQIEGIEETDVNVDIYVFQKTGKCVHCVYEEKKKLKIRSCQICRQLLPKNKWKYCNEDCAEEGAKKNQKNYWLKNIKIQSYTWQKYNNYKNVHKYEKPKKQAI